MRHESAYGKRKKDGYLAKVRYVKVNRIGIGTRECLLPRPDLTSMTRTTSIAVTGIILDVV